MPQEPKPTPRHQSNSYFSFFDLSQKVEFSSKYIVILIGCNAHKTLIKHVMSLVIHGYPLT